VVGLAVTSMSKLPLPSGMGTLSAYITYPACPVHDAGVFDGYCKKKMPAPTAESAMQSAVAARDVPSLICV